MSRDLNVSLLLRQRVIAFNRPLRRTIARRNTISFSYFIFSLKLKLSVRYLKKPLATSARQDANVFGVSYTGSIDAAATLSRISIGSKNVSERGYEARVDAVAKENGGRRIALSRGRGMSSLMRALSARRIEDMKNARGLPEGC